MSKDETTHGQNAISCASRVPPDDPAILEKHQESRRDSVVTEKPVNQDMPPEAPQPALRTRTFLKGIVYYDNRRVTIDCTVRDLSDTGARIVFPALVTVPDNIELYIPQKETILPARVRRRNECEIGVSFQDQRSGEPRRAIDGNIAERVTKIESELIAMKRLLKKLQAEILPNDNET